MPKRRIAKIVKAARHMKRHASVIDRAARELEEKLKTNPYAQTPGGQSIQPTDASATKKKTRRSR